MKKISISLLLAFLTFTAFSQSSKVVTAFNYHRNGELAKAKVAIDEAVKNEKTIADAKAWFYRGNIYLDIANSPDSAIRSLDPDPLGVSLESYNKATEYDAKQLYKADIEKYTVAIAESYYNYGVVYYNLQDFKGACNSFIQAYEVNQTIGKTDTVALFNAAVSADLAGDPKASLEYYKKSLELGNNTAEIYNSVSELYKKAGDTTMALNIAKEGRQMYPDDFNLLITETNIYLARNDSEKALKNLEAALQFDKTNPSIFFAVGTIYDQLGIFEKAESSYLSAIQLKPDYFEANYNLGALYVNKAATILEEANNLPLDAVKEYEEAKKQADELLKKSIPFLEKSLELMPDDTNTMVSLKEIYTRLGMLEKASDMDKRIHQ